MIEGGGERNLYPYFLFIPANKPNYQASALQHGIRRIIFDLEDSVPKNQLEYALQSITNIHNKDDLYTRAPLLNDAGILDTSLLRILLDSGLRKLMIPKLESVQQAIELKTFLTKTEKWCGLELFLLVESSRALSNIVQIIEILKDYLKYTSLGIYDYASDIGASPESPVVSYAKLSLTNTAKAFNLKIFDAPLLSITEKSQFQEEVLTSFNNGGDGKLIIHPIQREWLKEISFLTIDQLENLKFIYQELSSRLPVEGIVSIEGKFYEKPHLNLIKRKIDMEIWNDT